MIAAIFSPGPSLRLHIAQRGVDALLCGYDRTWSINTAIKLIRTDWLAAGDSAFFSGLLGAHRPAIGVLTMADNRKTIEADLSWRGLAVATWGDLPLIAEHARLGRPINWSLQTALCQAAMLGATRVDLYGCDLTGTADATGYVGEDRTDDRWRREASDLAFTTALLSDRSITVTRITP